MSEVNVYVDLSSGVITFSPPDETLIKFTISVSPQEFTIDMIVRLIGMKNTLGFTGWAKIVVSLV